MIVWLASFPRSGNTFFRAALWHVYGQPTYSVHNHDSAPLLFTDRASDANVPDRHLDRLADSNQVYWIKTHHPPAALEARLQTEYGDWVERDKLRRIVWDSPAVYLVRDGRDAVVSYGHYLQDRSSARVGWLNRFPLFRRMHYRHLLHHVITTPFFAGWSGNALAWKYRPSESATICIRFEDLVSKPDLTFTTTLNQLGLHLQPRRDEFPRFDELQKRSPSFFRKGVVGGWHDEMPESAQRLFWMHHAEAMVHFGYAGALDFRSHRGLGYAAAAA